MEQNTPRYFCMTTKKVYKTCAINVPFFRIEVILCSGQLTIQECVVFKLVYPFKISKIFTHTTNNRTFKNPFSEYLPLKCEITAKGYRKIQSSSIFCLSISVQKIIFPPMLSRHYYYFCCFQGTV